MATYRSFYARLAALLEAIYLELRLSEDFNLVYPSHLLLFDRGFSQNGSLGEKTLISKRITSTYDPEAVFGQCVGQWVVGSLPKVLSINLSAGMQNYLHGQIASTPWLSSEETLPIDPP